MKLFVVSYSVFDELNNVDGLFLSDPEVFTSMKDAIKGVEGIVNDELMEYLEGEEYEIDDNDNCDFKAGILDRKITISSTYRTFVLKIKTK